MALLEGKTAVITGGARGIGLAIGTAFAGEGANIVLADIDGDGARSSAEALAATNQGRVLGVEADVTDETSTERLADEAADRFGGVDIAVANAGVLLLQHAIDTDVAAFRRLIDVNLTGAFITAKVFAKRMVARSAGGRIIFTSSLFGVRGGAENTAYSASKFAIIGMTECMAAELGRDGITVNAVCPGQVDTDMMRQLANDRAAMKGTTPDVELGLLTSRIAAGRLGDPAEIADAYVFLASDLGRYVTGRELVVDGGWLVG
jgi:NAD(P)-dependent dehydrogenase (short-subunit alcohol dehydrogenase family)